MEWGVRKENGVAKNFVYQRHTAPPPLCTPLYIYIYNLETRNKILLGKGKICTRHNYENIHMKFAITLNDKHALHTFNAHIDKV